MLPCSLEIGGCLPEGTGGKMFNGAGVIHKGTEVVADSWMPGITRFRCDTEIRQPEGGDGDTVGLKLILIPIRLAERIPPKAGIEAKKDE